MSELSASFEGCSFSDESYLDDTSLELSYDVCELPPDSKGLNLQNSCINVQNSSEVVIGPVTHFHGPVSIIQNPNELDTCSKEEKQSNSFRQISGKLTKSESVSSECSFQNRKCLSPKRNLYYILAAISTIVVVMITTSVIFSRDIPIDNDLEEDDNLTSIGNHSLIYRNQWDGRPPLFRNTLRFPVKYVIISHTEWPTCNNLDVCSHFMRAIQSYHMEVNGSEPDIGFNFVVGGDGNIYVGRGWHTTNFHMNSSIGISFMGNFEINELTDVMIDAALSLISYGEENKIFSSRYRIVGHNQTYPTESPGENVYRIIKNWDHFVNATVHHS